MSAQEKAAQELIDYIQQESAAHFGELRQPGDINKNDYARMVGIDPKQADYILRTLARQGKLSQHKVFDAEQGRHVTIYRKASPS